MLLLLLLLQLLLPLPLLLLHAEWGWLRRGQVGTCRGFGEKGKGVVVDAAVCGQEAELSLCTLRSTIGTGYRLKPWDASRYCTWSKSYRAGAGRIRAKIEHGIIDS